MTSAIGEQGAPRDSQHDISAAHDIPPHRPRRELAVASIGALGVVYGDIGTSPLYAIKRVPRVGALAARACSRRCRTCSACCRWCSGR